MILFNQLTSFISKHPEEANVYIAIVTLVIAIIALFVDKAKINKKIFKQRGGKNSQNIQGDKVDVTMRDNQWK